MPNTDIPDHTVTLWLNLFHTRFMRISFAPVSHPLCIHTTRDFKVSLIWHFQVTNNTGIFVQECRKKNAHKIHFLKQNHGLTDFAQCVICRDENINHIEVSVGANCSICWGQLNVYVLIFWGYDQQRVVLFQCFLVSTLFWLCFGFFFLVV